MAMIRKALEARGEARDTVLVPDSAHGTNPASAAMAGFKALEIKSTPAGLVDVDALAAKLDEKVAVLIAGPCGTGKSHIAQAIGHAAVRQGHDVLFTSQSQLLGSLHAARATDSLDRKFQNLVKVPLLIIDDFGLKPLRPPHDEDFHDLDAERYERTATVITSNLDFGEWGDAFPNQLLGAATLDRLRHGAYRVVLDGKSYRSPRPLDDPLEKQSISGK